MAPGDGTMPSTGPLPEVGEVAVGDNASMGRLVGWKRHKAFFEVLEAKKQMMIENPNSKLNCLGKKTGDDVNFC